jgi:hypothetical protein
MDPEYPSLADPICNGSLRKNKQQVERQEMSSVILCLLSLL